MMALDTNVLVRLLIDDRSAPEQTLLAKSLRRKAQQIFVPQIVQVEVVWVLESAYGYDRKDVIKVLKHLQASVVFELQQFKEFAIALKSFENHPADFSDYLIFAACEANQYQLFTFDKKLARMSGVKLLEI